MLENTLRVLVADDIASNRTIVGAFLAHLNCTPLYAADGQEAVDLFRREAPDVVLMDLMMPRMDGFEAIRQIRAMEDERWVPIIIVSALSGEGDIVQGLEIGPTTTSPSRCPSRCSPRASRPCGACSTCSGACRAPSSRCGRWPTA